MSDHAVKLFTLQQRRITIESIAYIRPVIVRREEQLLMVPPRAFLYGGQQRRMMGCTMLFRYIDSRSAMGEIGFIERIDRAYLAVVHAMAESAAPSGHGRETNPGMFRTVLTAWNDQLVNYTHPPAEDVEGLIDEAIDVANTAQAPACLRVASLTFTLLSARVDVADRHGARLIAVDQFGLVRDPHDQCGKRASRLADRFHLLPVPEQHDRHQRGEPPPELEVEPSEARCHRR